MDRILVGEQGWWDFIIWSKDGGTSSFGTEEFLAIRHSSKFLRAHLVFLDVLGGLYPISRNWASSSDTKETLFWIQS